jgi:CheY-like chemotaxis protein
VLCSGLMNGPPDETERPTILLVDDMQDVRISFRMVLEQNGFAVLDTWEPREALAMLEDHPVDVALIDLYMPGEMDGLGLIKALRDLGRKLPIIAISGAPHVAHEACLRTARLGGADAVLTKPIPANELVKAVRRVMGSGPLP